MVAPLEEGAGPGVEPAPGGGSSRNGQDVMAGLALELRVALGWAGRCGLATSPYLPMVVRRYLLRRMGIQVGATVNGLTSCIFDSGNTTIGNGTHVSPRAWFEGYGNITIGDDCLIGPEAMFVTSNHTRSGSGVIARSAEYLDVTVGRRSWIGARSTLLPGVRVGEGVTIAAGSVVTKDCEAGGIYAGVPAKRIR